MKHAFPLTPAQATAFVGVAARELTWTLPQVAREVRGWRAQALRIPPGPLRDDALITLERERLNTDGAALFSVLPKRRDLELLRLLAAYQILLDYLDTISERPCSDPLANGRQLHLALIDALDPGRPLRDYYRFHPWREDGGYIRALVEACRRGCLALPSYALVQPRVIRAGELMAVQAFNNDQMPSRRNAGLVAWAARELPEETETDWVELAAASSSTLWTLAFLALSADPSLTEREIEECHDAYFPWICAASTLLDTFVDQAEDAENGKHNYFEHYPSQAVAVERLKEIVFQSTDRARRLRRGPRHEMIAAGMVAMYLTKSSAAHPELRAASARIRRAAGPFPALQIPIMRTIRVLRGLQAA